MIVDIADDGSLEFTGTAEPGSMMVEVTLVGTGVIAGSTVDAAGNWTVTYDAATYSRQSLLYRDRHGSRQATPDPSPPLSR